MIIQAKGTKQDNRAEDPALRFVFKSMDRRTKTPYAIALALLAFMVYLRTLVTSQVFVEEEKSKRPFEDFEGEFRERDLEFELLAGGEPDQRQTDSIPANEDEKPAEPAQVIRSSSVTVVNLDEKSFSSGDFFFGSGQAEFVAPLLRAANDNGLFAFDTPQALRGQGNEDFGIDISAPQFVPSDGGGLPPGFVWPNLIVPDFSARPPRAVGPNPPGGTPGGGQTGGTPGSGSNNPGTGNGNPGGSGNPGGNGNPGGGSGNPGGGNGNPGGGNGGGSEDDDDPDTRAPNRAPTVRGPVYLMDVTGCMATMIGLSALLHGAIDPDGDPLAVVGMTASSGTLTPSGAGWSFLAAPQMLGPVTLNYWIYDGELLVHQTAHFSVVRSMIDGTQGDDALLGTQCADDIDGRDGDDNIDARGGNDVIRGGAGDDHIVAGAGDDTIFAGDGDDVVMAGTGNDHVSGGAGNDTIFGEAGDDVLFGDGGNDEIAGGDGADVILGGEGEDRLFGDDGDDTIDGEAGDDIVKGGAGDDTVAGGAGDDKVFGGDGDDTVVDGEGSDKNDGGAGNDRIVAALDQASDTHVGGAGCDVLDLSATKEGVKVDLSEGFASGDEIGTDVVASIESVTGGSGDDELTGDAGANTLSGKDGDDVIDGGAGDDHLKGGSGDDTVRDGEGDDVVHAQEGDDLVIAAADGDDDHFDGGKGFDTLDYSQATDGVHIDIVEQKAESDEVGEDTFNGFEAFIGGSGDDYFTVGGDVGVTLFGGAGEDTFEFVGGATNPSSQITFEILDFRVGDKVRMKKYELFEEVFDELEDEFERLYDNRIDDDDIAIRYKHEKFDAYERTLIEADFNNDDIYETTITLDGRHLIVMIETA